jgi:hypothetical protein
MEAAVKMLKPGTKVGARAAVFVVMLVLVPVLVCPWLVVMASLRPVSVQNTEVTAIIKSIAESFGVKHIQGNLSHQMKQCVEGCGGGVRGGGGWVDGKERPLPSPRVDTLACRLITLPGS